MHLGEGNKNIIKITEIMQCEARSLITTRNSR